MMPTSDLDRLKAALDSLEAGKQTSEENSLIRETLASLLNILDHAPGEGSLPERLQALADRQGRLELLARAEERQTAELDALRMVTSNLTSSLDLKQILHSVLAAVLNLVQDVRDAYIFVYESGKLTFGASLFSDGHEDTTFTNVRPHGLTYSVARLAKIVSVDDMFNDPLFKDTGWSGSIAGLPLKIGLRVVGVLTAYRSEVRKFTEDDLRLLQVLAEYAAVAVENDRLHGLIDRQTQLDALTGFHNRRALEGQLELEIHRYNESNSTSSAPEARPAFSLLMMDLGGIKQINDQYGRPAGDHVLKEVTYNISQALRKTDFLARYSGEVMAAVLADTDRETLLNVAGRIQEYAAASRFNLPDISQKALTVSIGFALCPADGTSSEEILAAADAALQKARQNQAGGIVYAGDES